VLEDLGGLYGSIDRHYEDAAWVGYRFAEILPVTAQDKQACLEVDDPLQRLQIVRKFIDAVREVDVG
jgi:hypothetical protein